MSGIQGFSAQTLPQGAVLTLLLAGEVVVVDEDLLALRPTPLAVLVGPVDREVLFRPVPRNRGITSDPYRLSDRVRLCFFGGGAVELRSNGAFSVSRLVAPFK